MSAVHWVVQTDLGNASGIGDLIAALERAGVSYTPLAGFPPFSTQPPTLPGLDDRLVVVYGTTNLVALVARHRPWQPGVFFDPEQFTYSAWAKHYGEYLLNAPSEVVQTTLGQLATMALPWADVFARPERDLKEFNGGVHTPDALRAFAAAVAAGGFPLIDAHTPVVVGPAHGIDAEWRVFITDTGEVLGSSRYRHNGRMAVVADTPEAVLAFAQARAREWSPAPLFVMDIAQSGEGLYIVEAQCAHSAGLYAVDLDPWVRGVSARIERWAREAA